MHKLALIALFAVLLGTFVWASSHRLKGERFCCQHFCWTQVASLEYKQECFEVMTSKRAGSGPLMVMTDPDSDKVLAVGDVGYVAPHFQADLERIQVPSRLMPTVNKYGCRCPLTEKDLDALKELRRLFGNQAPTRLTLRAAHDSGSRWPGFESVSIEFRGRNGNLL